MTTHFPTTPPGLLADIVSAPAVRTAALFALCAAYIQGPLTKIFDFGGAIAEMEHFGLSPAPVFAVVVIAFELTASAMVVSGKMRWLGALALAGFTILATFIALRFWELPAGMERMMATNAFFEHLGLTGAFVLVTIFDITKGAEK
ncbi:DoxX family protein [Agrobacterium sp. S2]|nr:DoxX family protein [Agrobacterium sp. S2]